MFHLTHTYQLEILPVTLYDISTPVWPNVRTALNMVGCYLFNNYTEININSQVVLENSLKKLGKFWTTHHGLPILEFKKRLYKAGNKNDKVLIWCKQEQAGGVGSKLGTGEG